LISNFANGTDPYKYPNTDWYDSLYRNALITGHNLSIRGGSEKLSSFLSLNYLSQEGILMNSKAERFGIRANVESKVKSLDWKSLVEHGFEDIDPQGYFTGKHPKLRGK
jgi:hypothetical protein